MKLITFILFAILIIGTAVVSARPQNPDPSNDGKVIPVGKEEEKLPNSQQINGEDTTNEPEECDESVEGDAENPDEIDQFDELDVPEPSDKSS